MGTALFFLRIAERRELSVKRQSLSLLPPDRAPAVPSSGGPKLTAVTIHTHPASCIMHTTRPTSCTTHPTSCTMHRALCTTHHRCARHSECTQLSTLHTRHASAPASEAVSRRSWLDSGQQQLEYPRLAQPRLSDISHSWQGIGSVSPRLVAFRAALLLCAAPLDPWRQAGRWWCCCRFSRGRSHGCPTAASWALAHTLPRHPNQLDYDFHPAPQSRLRSM